MGGLNNRHSFLTVLEAGKSKIKVPANSVPGERSLPVLQPASHLLIVSSQGGERAALVFLSLQRTLILLRIRAPPP